MENDKIVGIKGAVAVFCPFHGMGEKVLIGIANYFRDNPNLSFQAIRIQEGRLGDEFNESDFQGAIILDNGEMLPPQLEALSIPTIRIFNRKEGKKTPLVTVDHDEIGRLAAQHLHGRGFRSFAFVGGIDAAFAKQRYFAYKRYLDDKGVHLHLFSEAFPSRDLLDSNASKISGFRDRMKTWLDALPKPVGIYALDDWKAFETQMACKKMGIKIPEDVAIIGVNDDDLACHICNPNLSSIRLPLEKIGFEAGNAVVELLNTGTTHDRVFKCIGLVTRGSTNTFAVSDTVVEEALKFMQRESNKPIRVEEVLQHVGVSRSLLERRFRGEIGRTPLVEMRRQRVERARELLADTELAINKIAELCGFASNIRFTTVFREQVGVTPTEFRSQMRNLTLQTM